MALYVSSPVPEEKEKQKQEGQDIDPVEAVLSQDKPAAPWQGSRPACGSCNQTSSPKWRYCSKGIYKDDEKRYYARRLAREMFCLFIICVCLVSTDILFAMHAAHDS